MCVSACVLGAELLLAPPSCNSFYRGDLAARTYGGNMGLQDALATSAVPSSELAAWATLVE
jgi:hypothetical protein